MKYIKNKDNFDLFVKNWNIENEYVLFGASKECVQFIRTMDYLLGPDKLKIKYIVDHETSQVGVYDNILDLSFSYHYSNTISNSRSNIEVKHLDNFKGKEKVIITSDEFRMTFKNYLFKLGYEEDIDFCWYKKVGGIWPYVYKNKTHMFQADLLVTERCNLSCTYCNMFIPYYKEPKHSNLDMVINDIDMFFNKVDFISTFHLVGGEPFLYPYIGDVIDHLGKNYRNKIDKIIITSNGTITPKDETFNFLRKYKVLVAISDYTDSIDFIGKKFNRVLEKYKENNIDYYSREELSWYDFGDARISKNMTTDELIKHFDSCTAPFRGLHDGKFYFCHLNTSSVLAKIHPENENDFVYLDKVSGEDLIKFDLGYTNLGYVTFCDNCNGCNTGIKVPVTPREQGLRI
jgi:organic radical activating enzyme